MHQLHNQTKNAGIAVTLDLYLGGVLFILMWTPAIWTMVLVVLLKTNTVGSATMNSVYQ